MSVVSNRQCPLCDQYVPPEVPQEAWKIHKEERCIHKTCANNLVEQVLKNRMEHNKIKPEKKKRKASS